MPETLYWWLAIEVMGIVGFPLVYVFFPRLPDRGYAFAKPFGMLMIGFAFWILGSAWVLSNNAGGIVWVVLMIGAASGFLAWQRRDEIIDFLRRKWALLLVIEGLFLLAFVFAVYLRSFTPEIAGTEKPMDFAFLNASTVSEHFAPNDPWLSGHTISYYYGGYFLVAMTGKLANVDTSVGYNLGLAMIAALAVVGAFGLVYNLVTLHEERAKKKVKLLGAPLVFGLAAAVLLTVIGNLEGLLEFLAAHGVAGSGFWNWVNIKGLTSVGNSTDSWYPTQHWWWWRAARIVTPDAPETITEFPFFSFLLGDLHPHVMAIPFGLLGIASAVRLLQEEETLDLMFWTRHQFLLVALAVIVGGLSFLNTWDLPTFFFLLVVAALARNYLSSKRWGWQLLKQTLGFAVPLGIVSVLAYVPYHKAFIPAFGFASQADGVAPVEGNGTLPFHALVFWGPMAILMLPFAAQRLVSSLKGRPWRPSEWVAVAPGLAVVGLWFLWVLVRGNIGSAISDRGSAWITAIILVVVLTLLLATLRREIEAYADGEGSLPVVVALVAGSLAALLVLGAEFFYVKDAFNNRMNTVFKLYYQAWIFLAVGGGFALYYMLTHWLPSKTVLLSWRAAWGGAALVLLAAGLAYPVGATLARTDQFGLPRHIDGLAFAKQQAGGDYQIAEWLSNNANPSDVIAEMVGNDSIGYEWGSTGRISSWTGLSTVYAWPGHEVQWRGGDKLTAGRLEDVNTLYASENAADAQRIVDKYGIDYIVVGSLEQQSYPPAALEKFDSMYPKVYPPAGSQTKVAIYQTSR
jgi:YYY domain-containing protein